MYKKKTQVKSARVKSHNQNVFNIQ